MNESSQHRRLGAVMRGVKLGLGRRVETCWADGSAGVGRDACTTAQNGEEGVHILGCAGHVDRLQLLLGDLEGQG